MNDHPAPDRDNLKIENSGTSFGVTNGNVTNDNRTMTGNNVVSGNQTNNSLPKGWLIAVLCVTLIIVLLIGLIAFIVWLKDGKSIPKDAEIRVGPQGGVYYVEKSGRKNYIDRKIGMELYLKQQQKKEADMALE